MDFTPAEGSRRELSAGGGLLADAPLAVQWIDTAGYILCANRAAAHILRVPVENCAGRNLADFLPDKQTAAAVLECLAQGRQLHNREMRLRAADGTILRAVIDTRPVMEGGRIIHIRCFIRETATAGALSNSRLLADASRALIEADDHAVALKGVARAAIPALGDWCCVRLLEPDGRIETIAAHSDPDQDEWARALHDLVRPDAPTPCGLDIVMENAGPVVVNEITAELLEAAAHDAEHLEMLREAHMACALLVPMTAVGRVLGAMVFVTQQPGRRYLNSDVMLAEDLARRCAVALSRFRALKESEGRQRDLWAVIDSMPDGVVSLDAAMAVRDINSAAGRLLGLPRESVVGRGHAEVLRFATDNGMPAFDLRAAAADSRRSAAPVEFDEIWLDRPTVDTPGVRRQVPVAVTVAAIDNGAVVVFRDVTRRRESDELRDSIISMVSHDLRTPLTHIKGFANSLIQPDVSFTDDTRLDFIRTIDREADRLARMVADVLEMSHLESGKIPLEPEHVPPSILADAGISGAATYLAGRTFEKSIADDLPPVMADVSRIERVFVNLIENASKYSPAGSRIALEACREGAEVIFCIADEGPGIPEDSLEIIFQRFTRLRDPEGGQASGIGLGLALCKTLVEGHGGRIWVESTRGAGSRFYFALPVAPRRAPRRRLG